MSLQILKGLLWKFLKKNLQDFFDIFFSEKNPTKIFIKEIEVVVPSGILPGMSLEIFAEFVPIFLMGFFRSREEIFRKITEEFLKESLKVCCKISFKKSLMDRDGIPQ